MAVSPIPEGYSHVIPYLIIKDAASAVEFYKNAFNAEEHMRMPSPDGTLAHGEVKIGGSVFMISEEFPDMGYSGPQSLGGTPVSVMFYTEDVDALYAQALEAGAEQLRAVEDQFYGDRAGTLKDPYGHVWTIATHKEDLTPEQVNERAKEFFASQGGE